MTNTNAIKNDQTFPGSFGLVVCGGSSSRMGIDKSMLSYYEKPQRYEVYEMLQPFCERVFISCNEEQLGTIPPGYDSLADDPLYQNNGPMAALLTAFDRFPGKNILFIGCDYPFLSPADLQQFSVHCRDKDHPVAFYNEKAGCYEPLLAWYPRSSFYELREMHREKQYSLQHFLNNTGAEKFYPGNKNSIISIDTHEAFLRACELIKTGN